MEHGQHFLQGGCLEGQGIDVDGWAAYHEDHDDVRDAGGGHFALPPGGVSSLPEQQGGTGDEEEDEAHHDDHAIVEEHDHLHCAGASAGQLHQLMDVTEEVVQDVGASEGQLDGQTKEDDAMK